MDGINWICKDFDSLTPNELYGIIRLRNEVFVVEQDCVFQDADDKDQGCFHLMGFVNEILVAYARLVPPGYIYTQPSIGRVVTSPAFRNKQAGKFLMAEAIIHCESLYGKMPIKIGAQLYLKKFYGNFGFQQIGDVYDEDGIDHIHMIRQ